MGVSDDEESYGQDEHEAPTEPPAAPFVEPAAETSAEPRAGKAPGRAWKTDDEVTISYHGRTVEGWVLLASGNAESVMLGFEAILGGHVGSMPVLWNRDVGAYLSIMTGLPVGLSVGAPVLTALQSRVLETCKRFGKLNLDRAVTLEEAAAGLEVEVTTLCDALNELLLLGLVPPPEPVGSTIIDPSRARVG